MSISLREGRTAPRTRGQLLQGRTELGFCNGLHPLSAQSMTTRTPAGVAGRVLLKPSLLSDKIRTAGQGPWRVGPRPAPASALLLRPTKWRGRAHSTHGYYKFH